MAKKKENYLDYVPAISGRHTWSKEDGVVTIHMVHRGWNHWIAQKLFGRPRVSHIRLDEMGSFIYPLIDDKRDMGEIALLVKEEFGEDAEPLYERLAKYMQILRNNELIYFKGKGKQPN